MSGRAPCPACGYPFRGDWILLSSRCGKSKRASAYLCPRCSMGQGPRPARLGGVEQQVKRAYAYQQAQGSEHRARRRAQVQRYLTEMNEPQRVLELAGTPLIDAQECPGSPAWQTLESAIEDWSRVHAGSVDLLISTFVLEYLEQPRSHLSAIAQALSSTGRALIEVNNLCCYPESLEREFLDPERLQIFTPHALATLCSHAGLAPVEIDMGERITMVCRKARGYERPQLFPGPCPKVVARRCRGAMGGRVLMPEGVDLVGAAAFYCERSWIR